MSNASRIVQIGIWTVTIFLLTPSKLEAIATTLLIGGLLIAILVGCGVLKGISRWILK